MENLKKPARHIGKQPKLTEKDMLAELEQLENAGVFSAERAQIAEQTRVMQPIRAREPSKVPTKPLIMNPFTGKYEQN
jgi:hypothetical protein